MRTKLFAVAACAVLLAGIGAYAWHVRQGTAAGNGRPRVAGPAPTDTVSERLKSVTAQAAHARARKARSSAYPFTGVPRSRQGLAFEDDPFIVESAEEQAWLDRQGYPNARQWAAYTQASDAMLGEAAAAGDVAAQTILDHRRLMAGDEAAIDDMLVSAAEGHGFALQMLASYMAPKDRLAGYALSRVLEMRGNYRVAGARDVMFGKPLNQVERMQAENEALRIYKSLYDLQKSIKGPNSPPVDPRPIGG